MQHRLFLFMLTLMLSWTLQGQESVFEQRHFSRPVSEIRYQTLIDELRCLVCQNQAISDSNSDLAAQLRDEVYNQIMQGQSDEEILDFMTTRYGDYVLFNPPVKQSTLLLWVGPFLILGIALAFLFYQIRRNSDRDGAESPK